MTRTLDDLRSTLAGHADDLADTGLRARNAAVATRVRHVRRQRRAALAGGLAAVVAIVGTGLALGPLQRHDRSLEPTAPLAGHAIPRDIDVTGFTYALASSAESKPGDQKLTLSLPKTDHDRVVSLVASGLGSGDATLFRGNGSPDVGPVRGKPAGYDAGRVLDRVAVDSAVDAPVVVGPEATHLTVRLRNAAAGAVVGLAAYDQTGSLPEGVSAHGMAFPKTVGNEHLVTGAIGRPGDASVSITFRGPVRNPDLESLCATAAKGVWGHVTQTGVKGWSGGECGPLDPIADVNLGVGHSEGVPAVGFGPGLHTLTITAVPHTRGHRDLRLALGLYDNPAPLRRVDGMNVGTRVVSGGRLWRLDRVVPYVEGRTVVDATSGPVMLGMTYVGRSASCPVATGSDRLAYYFTCNESAADGPSETSGELLMPGATYTLSTQNPDNSRKPGSGLKDILVYRPAD